MDKLCFIYDINNTLIINLLWLPYTEEDNSIIKPSKLIAEIGYSVKFTCTSHVTVQWYHNNGPLPFNTFEVRHDDSMLNVLHIHSVQLNNSGNYECEGKDPRYGKYFTAEALLIVKSNIFFFILIQYNI